MSNSTRCHHASQTKCDKACYRPWKTQQVNSSDLLKPVTVVMSVTVLSRVVTGFVDTVTAVSRVVTGHLLGCHGLSRVLLKLSRECNGNVTEMSQLLETSRVHEMYCTNVFNILTITGTSTSREKTLAS